MQAGSEERSSSLKRALFLFEEAVPVVAWSLLVAALAVMSWVFLAHPSQGLAEAWANFAAELGSALLGSAVTAFAAMVLAVMAFSSTRRRKRAERKYSEMVQRSQERRRLQVGRFVIEDVFVVAACREQQPYTNHVKFEFDQLDRSTQRRPPAEYQALRSGRLIEMIDGAKRASVAFDDQPAVDLLNAGTVLAEERDGAVRTKYRLTPAVTSYHLWAATSNSLDRPFTASEVTAFPDSSSLRDAWRISPERLEDVGRLPAPAKVGVGTAVITNDNHLVVGLRGKTFVASAHDSPLGDVRKPVHFVAEGMIPNDLNPAGRLDPRVTALRGIAEELGLDQSGTGTGTVTKLVATGVFFDVKRWQPCFAFVARIDRSFDELNTLVHSATDYWESDQLIPMPMDIRDGHLRSLLLGHHESFRWASNHAQAVAYFACLHEFGFERFRTFVAAYR